MQSFDLVVVGAGKAFLTLFYTGFISAAGLSLS